MSIIEKIKSQQAKGIAANKKFIAGGYSLVKTFWLYWFIPIIIITLIDAFTKVTKTGILKTNIIIIIWSVVTLIAIFNINTVEKRIWKNIALGFVILTIVTRIFNLIIAL